MRKIVVLAVMLLTFGCASQEDKNILTIPVQYDTDKPFKESDFTYKVEIIPLAIDSSDIESYIGNCYRMLAYNDYLYIPVAGKGPKIFDKKGNYVKSIIAGRGPGEVLNISDLFIDRENDVLEIIEVNKTSKFSLTGDFIESNAEGFSCADICKFGDYYFMYDGYASASNYLLKIMSHKTHTPVDSMINKRKSDTGFTANNRFVMNNEHLYFAFPFDHYIYKINKGDSIPHKFAKVDNLLRNDECSEEDIMKLIEYTKTNKKVFMLTNLTVLNDGDLMTFDLNKGFGDISRVLYDKVKNEVYQYPISTLRIIHSDGEYEYALFSPAAYDEMKDKFTETEKLLAVQLLEKIEKNGIDTNPYVVKIKIIKK